MTTGKDSYNGLGVPLFGDFEMRGRTAATDIMTISGKAGQSGDFIVAQVDGDTEVFVVEDSGKIVSADWPVFNGTVASTKPAAGMTTGQVFFYAAANVYQLARAASATTLWRVVMTHNN
jgi:hypothetical protein